MRSPRAGLPRLTLSDAAVASQLDRRQHNLSRLPFSSPLTPIGLLAMGQSIISTLLLSLLRSLIGPPPPRLGRPMVYYVGRCGARAEWKILAGDSRPASRATMTASMLSSRALCKDEPRGTENFESRRWERMRTWRPAGRPRNVIFLFLTRSLIPNQPPLCGHFRLPFRPATGGMQTAAAAATAAERWAPYWPVRTTMTTREVGGEIIRLAR